MHIFREANRAADYLRKLENNGEKYIRYFVNPLPEALQTIIDEDVIGTLYYPHE